MTTIIKGKIMKHLHSTISTSVRLPIGADDILEKLTHDLNISKSQFMRDAIIEKIEDMLDIKAINDVLAKNEKTYSIEEIKHELNLEY